MKAVAVKNLIAETEAKAKEKEKEKEAALKCTLSNQSGPKDLERKVSVDQIRSKFESQPVPEEKEQREKRQEEINKKVLAIDTNLRVLIDKDEYTKSPIEKEQEKEMMKEIVRLVEEKNQLVLEEEEERRREEDEIKREGMEREKEKEKVKEREQEPINIQPQKKEGCLVM